MLELFNEEQSAAYKAISNPAIFRNKPEYHLLTGAAGTGKSTVAALAIKSLVDSGHRITVTALTHKACAVVRAMLVENGVYIPVKTVHSTLSLIVKPDYNTGATNLVQTRCPQVPSQSVFVVDEISMADKFVVNAIKSAAEQFNLMVLFIGDINQIPPVSTKLDRREAEEDVVALSPVFTMAGVVRHELTKTVRTDVSPITRLARNFIDSHELPSEKELVTEDGTSIVLVSHDELVERAKSLAVEAREKKDSNHVIILAYKNTTVTHYNQMLRDHAYGSADPFEPGETLVANDGCAAWMIDGEESKLFNNEVVVVDKRKAHEQHGVKGFKVMLTDGRICFAAADTSKLIIAMNEEKKRAIKSTKDGRWRKYYAMKNSIADLRPVYAVTVHKSQSSSYSNVLIDLGDIHSGRNNEMLKKLCYTAITRARHSLVLAGHEVFWNSQESDRYSEFLTW